MSSGATLPAETVPALSVRRIFRADERAGTLPPSLADVLARSSAAEMVDAVGLRAAPGAVRAAARAAFSLASAPIGRVLARFDARIATHGIAAASASALADFGAEWTCDRAVPVCGPLLVVSNHPGAYDALALLAALGRRDVAIVAHDRSFLRALPALSPHLLFVPEAGSGTEPSARAIGARRALRHLAAGGALLHFGAGRIEPDPDFFPDVERAAGLSSRAPHGPLAPWLDGTGLLVRGAARCRGRVVAAVVGGVHSRRAKRSLAARIAERRGITTLAPLLQIALAYRDVRVRLRVSESASAGALAAGATDAAITARVRSMALDLLGRWSSPMPAGMLGSHRATSAT